MKLMMKNALMITDKHQHAKYPSNSRNESRQSITLSLNDRYGHNEHSYEVYTEFLDVFKYALALN